MIMPNPAPSGSSSKNFKQPGKTPKSLYPPITRPLNNWKNNSPLAITNFRKPERRQSSPCCSCIRYRKNSTLLPRKPCVATETRRAPDHYSSRSPNCGGKTRLIQQFPQQGKRRKEQCKGATCINYERQQRALERFHVCIRPAEPS